MSANQTKPKITLDYKQIKDIELDGINGWDAPDFVDAFITSATYMGREMTEDELNALNEDSDFVHEKVMEHLH
jgi:hypothetical protein